MRLNLGCGSVTPAGWQNVDYAIGARAARWPVLGPIVRKVGLFTLPWDPRITIHDLTRPFPWRDNSADAIYSSHTLEHLDRAQGEAFLGQCARVLKPGGVLRIVVPDLAAHVDRYLRGAVQADGFLEDLGVLYGAGTSGVKRFLAPFYQYPHKCMYDQQTLLSKMRFVGLTSEPRAPFESRIAGLECVELRDRTIAAVIVEGVKRGPR